MLPRCGPEARNPAIYTYPTANLYMDVRYIGQLQALIADDSEFMLTAYKRALESQSNLQIMVTATNGEEAIQKAKQTAPDVAILDAGCPYSTVSRRPTRSGFSGWKRP